MLDARLDLVDPFLTHMFEFIKEKDLPLVKIEKSVRKTKANNC